MDNNDPLLSISYIVRFFLKQYVLLYHIEWVQLKKFKKNQFNGMVDHCEVNCICQQSKWGIAAEGGSC